MKKIVNIFLLVVFFTGVIITNSCSKDEESDNCASLWSAFSQANQSLTNDPLNSEKCWALKTALNNYVNGCVTLTASEKQEFQEMEDLLDCE